MHRSINEMLSTCILCAGTTLFWKGHRYGYMCIYMYLSVTEDFKELMIKIIGYLLIFIHKKFEKVVKKKYQNIFSTLKIIKL